MLSDQYLRLMTKEEVKKILDEQFRLEPHQLLKIRPSVSNSDGKLLGDDIKKNGMKKPVVLHNSIIEIDEEDGTEYRQYVIVEGHKRFVAAAHNARINPLNLPFAEFMGSDEELEEWIKRERDMRSHDETKDRIIKAIEVTLPEINAMKKWKEHPVYSLYKDKIKGRDDLVAKIDGISKGNIHKGKELQEAKPHVYEVMKLTDITFEEAYRTLDATKWTKDWMQQVLEKIYADYSPISSLRKFRDELEQELERFEEKEKVKKTHFQDAPVEDCKAKGKLIVQMDKIQGESNIALHKRAEGFTEALKPLANQWGITDVHVITGSIGKTLIDEALNKTFETEGALIETIALEKQQAKAIDEKELATYKKEQIAPDKKIKGKPKQYIGGKTKY